MRFRTVGRMIATASVYAATCIAATGIVWLRVEYDISISAAAALSMVTVIVMTIALVAIRH